MIPYAELKEQNIPATLSVEGTYNLSKVANFRASAHIGSFKGVTVGGMLYVRDKMVNRKTKFIVSESHKSVSFYNGRADKRAVFGPSADLKIGDFDETGLYARLQGGIEWQTYSNAYYKGYGSGSNGFSSIKLHAVAAKLRMAEYHNKIQDYNDRMGVGALASLTYVRRPWRRVTLYGGLDLGYLMIPGVEDDQTTGIKNSKGITLLEIKLGASIKI